MALCLAARPLLISRFLPFSVLLGALIAFAGLNQHSEVVSMKAAGLSAHQILAPMIVASLGVAVALFAFNELVVVKSRARSMPGPTPTIRPIPPDSGILSNVWIRDGNLARPDRHWLWVPNQLAGVTIYRPRGWRWGGWSTPTGPNRCRAAGGWIMSAPTTRR